MKRHGLLDPEGQDPAAVASRVAGVHAQVMSSAELAIGVRTRDMPLSRVSECLWEERTLLKIWAMRGTLHLIPTSEIDVWTSALGSRRYYLRDSWAKAYGLTRQDILRVVDAVRAALDGRRLTREELITAIAQTVDDPHLIRLLGSGWGSLLKPASYQGYLCFGPSRGQRVTFTSPASIRGSWEPVEELTAVKEVTRRHLRAYGPVGHARFAVWWGGNASRGREMFQSLASELAMVDVEGTKGYALASDLPALLNARPLDSVLLLGAFDPYTVAMCTHSQLLLPDPIFKSRVSRAAGWISPVLLDDGRIVGVWEYRRSSKRLAITVRPFVKMNRRITRRINGAAERIGEFLKLPLTLEIA